MTKTYEWTTPKGNKISATITAEQRTSDIRRDLDGYEYTEQVTIFHRHLDHFSINGEVKPSADFHNSTMIIFGYQGKSPLLVVIPDEIINDYTPKADPKEAAARREKFEKELEAEKRYQAHKASVYKMMDADNE